MTVEHKFRPKGEGEFEAIPLLERPPLRPQKTALVIIDMANSRCVRGIGLPGHIEKSGVSVDYYFERLKMVMPNLQRLLPVCRQHGVRVIWVVGGCYTPDFSDCIPQDRVTHKIKNALVGTWEMQIVDPLKVEAGDIYLVKAGSGGFSAPLDVRMRNMGIEQVIYTGMATSGCVLLTVTAGFDLGYYGWLVSDATATFSERLQSITEELVSNYMARIVSTDEMIKIITGEAKTPSKEQ